MQPYEIKPQSAENSLPQRLREMEKELLETEKALAHETLEHARTKETLAYTRGLLDRADKSEVAIHKYLDKQEDRHSSLVGKLEEKVIDANRKIATIARELGAKEERVAMLMGPGRLAAPGQDPITGLGAAPAAPAPQIATPAERKPPAPLSLDVPFFWAFLGGCLTLGIWTAPAWSVPQSAAATSAVWCVLSWFVLKYWSEIARLDPNSSPHRARTLKKICHGVAIVGGLIAVAFLGVAFFA